MFFDNLKTIATQVLILYLIAGIGFVTDKVGLFKKADAKRLIDLLFNVILPIAVIHTFMTMEYSKEHIKGILIAFVCAFATHLFGAGVALIIAAGIKIALSTLFSFSNAGDTFQLNYREIRIFFLIAVIAMFYKRFREKRISPILLIIISALMGIGFYSLT